MTKSETSKLASADSQEREAELPPLPGPCPQVLTSGWIRFTADQMRDYARAALAAHTSTPSTHAADVSKKGAEIDISADSTKQTDYALGFAHGMQFASSKQPMSTLTDAQIDALIKGCCHSDPVMASGEYCLTVDEVRAVLAAAQGEKK